MTIDPAGTQPGLSHSEPAHKTVTIQCRNEGCKCKQAIEISTAPLGQSVPSNRLYQCIDCKFTWGLPVGGAFQY